MAERYLKVGDPGCFQDMEIKSQPTEYHKDWTVHCPKCQGYGGWNLTLNAYGSGKHFQAGCDQCVGWGWVHPDNAKCVHDYRKELSQDECKKRGISHFGMCWHVVECTKCGKISAYDSSD